MAESIPPYEKGAVVPNSLVSEVSGPRPEYGGLRAATDAITLPEPEPRAVGVGLIMPAICSGKVARSQRPFIRDSESALKPFDFGDGLFNIHPGQYNELSCKIGVRLESGVPLPFIVSHRPCGACRRPRG